MHYVGFVFVDEPTKEAVAAAMEDHGVDNGRHWDWYRCGGRWDGYLLGEDEMKSRETDNGFNWNHDGAPHFFVEGYYFVAKEYYNEYELSTWSTPEKPNYGAILPTPNFATRYEDAIKRNPDKYVVVVDAHN